MPHLPLAVSYSMEDPCVILIDQRQLPTRLEKLECKTVESVTEGIQNLTVRGAPAIGIAAAYGLALAAQIHQGATPAVFLNEINRAYNLLAHSRPTASNLFHALDRVRRVIERHPDATPASWAAFMLSEAQALHQEDMAIGEAIGFYGAEQLSDDAIVMTHCNAGALATGNRFGTALAPIYIATSQGKRMRVFACETRPVLQGARLTSFELAYNGIPVTVVCDNMAASVFKQEKPEAVFVGCDRVAANGDMANKIGTYGLAILAAYHHVPFYVCAPSTTIDYNCPNGEAIPIEERADSEIRSLWYKEPMLAEEAGTWNPAFDVTPAHLITAYITETGIIYPPYAFKRGNGHG